MPGGECVFHLLVRTLFLSFLVLCAVHTNATCIALVLQQPSLHGALSLFLSLSLSLVTFVAYPVSHFPFFLLYTVVLPTPCTMWFCMYNVNECVCVCVCVCVCIWSELWDTSICSLLACSYNMLNVVIVVCMYSSISFMYTWSSHHWSSFYILIIILYWSVA